MHRILTELEQKIQECLRTYLPEVKAAELEENGTVYYMNGKNGTEFDWHVNDRLSDFMATLFCVITTVFPLNIDRSE